MEHLACAVRQSFALSGGRLEAQFAQGLAKGLLGLGLATDALAGFAYQAAQGLFIGAAGKQAVITERQRSAMLHLTLHTPGLGHVGTEFQAAQGQVRTRLDVIVLFATHGGRGGDLAVQGIQAVTQRDNQVFGYDGRARQLAGDEWVQVMLQPAGLAGLRIDVIQRVERQDLQRCVAVVMPDAPVRAVLQSDPAKLGGLVRARSQRLLLLVEQQVTACQCVLEEFGTLFPSRRVTGETTLLFWALIRRSSRASASVT